MQNRQLPVPNIYYTVTPQTDLTLPNPIYPPYDPIAVVEEDKDQDQDRDIDEEEEEITSEGNPSKPLLSNSFVNATQLKALWQAALQDNESLAFSDVVETHWAARAIRYATQFGMIEGVGNGKFQGSAHITRAAFVAMLVRALHIDTDGAGGVDSFSDIEGHWAEEYIKALHRVDVVRGTGNGTFLPNESITRAEMVVMLARMLQLNPITGESKFVDIAENWAADEIEQLSRAAIVFGVGNGKFAPNETATRDQSVVIIMRMLDIVLDLQIIL